MKIVTTLLVAATLAGCAPATMPTSAARTADNADTRNGLIMTGVVLAAGLVAMVALHLRGSRDEPPHCDAGAVAVGHFCQCRPNYHGDGTVCYRD
jgi:hypothetical protein